MNSLLCHLSITSFHFRAAGVSLTKTLWHWKTCIPTDCTLCSLIKYNFLDLSLNFNSWPNTISYYVKQIHQVQKLYHVAYYIPTLQILKFITLYYFTNQGKTPLGYGKEVQCFQRTPCLKMRSLSSSSCQGSILSSYPLHHLLVRICVII